MKNTLSPFADLFETNKYPYSRILRTSLKQKLKDCYHLFAGGHPTPYSNFNASDLHLGLFDYFTLGIPALCLGLAVVSFGLAQDYWPAFLLFIPSVLISIPLIIARVLFGATITLLCSPLIAIVHNLFYESAKENLDMVYALKGTVKERFNGKLEEKEMTLKQYMDKNNIEDLEKVEFDAHEFSSINGMAKTPNSYRIQTRIAEVTYFYFDIAKENSNSSVKQSSNIHAFFALNVGGVTSHTEYRKETDPERYSTLLEI